MGLRMTPNVNPLELANMPAIPVGSVPQAQFSQVPPVLTETVIQTKTGKNLPSQGNIDKAYKNLQNVMTDSAKKQAEIEAKQIALHDDIYFQNEKWKTEDMSRMWDQQKQEKELSDKLNNTTEELSKTKIDPNRWYNESSGRQALSAIAIGLGALASGLTGQKNTALEIIDRAIDRDIMAQKEEYDRKKDKVSLMQNEYGRMLNQFGREETAISAMKQGYYKAMENRFNMIAAQSNSQQVKNNAAMQVAQLQQKQAENAFNIQLSGQPESVTTTTEKPYLKTMREEDKYRTKFGTAANIEGARKVTDIESDYQTSLKNVNQLKKDIKDYGITEWASAIGKGKLQAGQDAMIELLRAKANMGVLNEGERAVLEGKMPFNSWLKGAFARPEMIISYIDSSMDQLKNKRDKTIEANIPDYWNQTENQFKTAKRD